MTWLVNVNSYVFQGVQYIQSVVEHEGHLMWVRTCPHDITGTFADYEFKFTARFPTEDYASLFVERMGQASVMKNEVKRIMHRGRGE